MKPEQIQQIRDSLRINLILIESILGEEKDEESYEWHKLADASRHLATCATYLTVLVESLHFNQSKKEN